MVKGYNSTQVSHVLALAEKRDCAIEFKLTDGSTQLITTDKIDWAKQLNNTLGGINYQTIVSHQIIQPKTDSLRLDSADFVQGKTLYHCDSYPLKHWELDNVGNLRFISPIARTGDLIYLNDQGIEYPEFVPETTLVNSLDSFKTKAVTLLHPPEKVTPANSMRYQRGLSGYTGFFDGKFLWLTGTATDQELINAIKNGRAKEISPGYDALIKQDGKKLIQASREGNHLAAVPRGRNGREVAFKVDSVSNSLVLRSSLTENDLPEPPKQLWARWV